MITKFTIIIVAKFLNHHILNDNGFNYYMMMAWDDVNSSWKNNLVLRLVYKISKSPGIVEFVEGTQVLWVNPLMRLMDKT